MPAPAFYGTIADVRTLTGVQPKHLDFDLDPDPTASLDAWIDARLRAATSLINGDRNRDYRAEEDDPVNPVPIPLGIHDIAVRMVGNLISIIQQRRANPVVRVDDFAVDLPTDVVMTKAIRMELRLFPAKPRFRFRRMKTTEELEGEA